jgi:hypothetical protein
MPPTKHCAVSFRVFSRPAATEQLVTEQLMVLIADHNETGAGRKSSKAGHQSRPHLSGRLLRSRINAPPSHYCWCSINCHARGEPRPQGFNLKAVSSDRPCNALGESGLSALCTPGKSQRHEPLRPAQLWTRHIESSRTISLARQTFWNDVMRKCRGLLRPHGLEPAPPQTVCAKA